MAPQTLAKYSQLAWYTTRYLWLPARLLRQCLLSSLFLSLSLQRTEASKLAKCQLATVGQEVLTLARSEFSRAGAERATKVKMVPHQAGQVHSESGGGIASLIIKSVNRKKKKINLKAIILKRIKKKVALF